MKPAARFGLGALVVAGGLGLVALGVAISQDDEAERAQYVAERSYVEGTCTITAVRVLRLRTADDGRRASLAATFTVHTPAGDVPGVQFRYSDVYWDEGSAARAAVTTHAPGASIGCYRDPRHPERAVLALRGPPSDEGASALGVGLFGALGVLVGLGVIAVPRRS
ncbi:MAG: hypothetical protein U0234_10090 [Sandaracinus sp.]